MKKVVLIAWLIVIGTSLAFSQTTGTLTVVATTSEAGGNYAPRNIVAMWIEDNQGNFVKTLLAYAANRKTHLNTWEASTTAAGSPFNTVDAITGATKNTHATRTCNWNGTDVDGNVVADGTYRLRMELTDKNSTGNFSTFTFTKGPNPENQTPANVPSFSSISIGWEPVATAVNDPELVKLYQVFPNPTNGIIRVSGENISEIQVYNSAGTEVYRATSFQIDLGGQPEGIYYLFITTSSGDKVAVKVLKQ